MASDFTPGPWKWWTSNSWKRLMAEWGGHTQPVIEPTVAPDGHPDCIVSEADMALLQTAPDLYKVLEQIVRDWDGEPEDMQEAVEVLAKARGKTGE